MFRIDCQSIVFFFPMHYRSPITWPAISWSAVNWAHFMPIWLADSDLNLRCCANGHALRVDAIGSKRRHSNDINDTSAVKNMFYRKSNYTGASIQGPVFPRTFDGRSNWSPINFGTWPEIISMIIFPSPIKLISDQLWELTGDHLNDHFSIAN